jgi:hypothetical protein
MGVVECMMVDVILLGARIVGEQRYEGIYSIGDLRSTYAHCECEVQCVTCAVTRHGYVDGCRKKGMIDTPSYDVTIMSKSRLCSTASSRRYVLVSV